MTGHMLIGETLFDLDSELPLRWKPEEERFRWQGEPFRRRVRVTLRCAEALPEWTEEELYREDGLRVGRDAEGNEVRVYTATFLAGWLVYARSVCRDGGVTIDFVNAHSIWQNPNIRLWNLVHMERFLLEADALVLHCSYLMISGKAILFSAPSGTGKTTQAKLWEKLTPGHIINGDKAIVQKRGGTWYACGYPFHGSAEECENEDYPIAAIVVVRQSPEDTIEPLRPMKRLTAVYSECTVNTWDADSVSRALNLVSDLVTGVEVVCQHCTMNDEACHTLRRYLEERNLCNCTI